MSPSTRFVVRFVTVSLVASALFAARSVEACSLCHCGDPTYTLVGSQIFLPKALRFGLDFDRYEKDQVSEEDPSLREAETEYRTTFSIGYSIHRWLTLLARVPIANRTIETGGESQSQRGFSDPELLAHVRLGAMSAGSWFALSAGVRPGWGENNSAEDGERLEEHLQPGSGATSYSVGGSFSRLVGPGSLFGSVGGRFNGRNEAGYQYGDVFLANLAYERPVAGPVNAIVEANFRDAGYDEEQPGENDPNTGGSVLYLSPRLLVRLGRGTFFRLGVQLPIAKALHGDQDEKVNVLSGLTFQF